MEDALMERDRVSTDTSMLVDVKIKGLEISYPFTLLPPQEEVLNSFEIAALARMHSSIITKIWNPLVDALKKTDSLPAGIEGIIAEFAEHYPFGARSKKVETLARKKAKEYVEEKIRQGRYNITQAKQSGLIDNSVDKIFADGEGEIFYEEASKELSADEQLDPMPMTKEELDKMLASKKEGESQ